MTRIIIALVACCALLVPLFPPVIVPALACALFIQQPRAFATGIGTVILLAAVELLTGRMFGVLSLPFAVVAVGAVQAEHRIAYQGTFVRAGVVASIMAVIMTVGSVAVASGIYGRGYFAARLAVALSGATLWMIPCVCAVVLLLCCPPWRGRNDIPTA